MMGWMRRLIPAKVKLWLRKWIQEKQRQFKAPKMLWGYTDSTGKWRNRTRISDTVSLYMKDNILIADNVFIGHFCFLDGTGALAIEEGAQLAGWNGIYTHSSHIAIRLYGEHYQDVPETEKSGYRVGKVSIGRYAFVGVGAKIFSEVSIGQGALIAANSVVTRSVSDYQIVSGNPAIEIGDTRKLDAKYLKDPQLREWYEEWQKN